MSTRTSSVVVLSSLVLLVLVQTSPIQATIQSNTCIVTPTNPCSLDTLTGPTLIYPGGNTRCSFDNLIDSEIQLNQTYFFQVFPGRQADRDKLLFLFQGGGACFDALTCDISTQCSKLPVFAPNAKASYEGILDIENPKNHFKDYTIVHVIYCTGDLHLGHTIHQAMPTAHRVLHAQRVQYRRELLQTDKSSCIASKLPNHQNGYSNMKTVLDWTIQNMGTRVQDITIGGFSAGALAAQTYTNFIKAQFRQAGTRNAIFRVFADSFIGIASNTPSPPVSRLFQFYQTCQLDLHLPSELSALRTCPPMRRLHETAVTDKTEIATTRTTTSTATATATDGIDVETFMLALLAANTDTTYGFLTHKEDLIQRMFYSALERGLGGLFEPFDNVQFYQLVVKQLKKYLQQQRVKMSTFLLNGAGHGIIVHDTALYRQENKLTAMEWIKTFYTDEEVAPLCTGGEQSPKTADWCSKDLTCVMCNSDSCTGAKYCNANPVTSSIPITTHPVVTSPAPTTTSPVPATTPTVTTATPIC